MTPKELVLNAIKFKPIPKTPVAVLDGYNWMMQRTGMTHQELFAMDADKAADFIIEQYEIIGSDLVYANAFANGALRQVMGNGDGSKPALTSEESIQELARQRRLESGLYPPRACSSSATIFSKKRDCIPLAPTLPISSLSTSRQQEVRSTLSTSSIAAKEV